jgi:hypothetical protein
MTIGQKAHLTLQQYLDFSIILKEDLANIFKFAVIRDPMDRAISTFLYLKICGLISENMDIDYFFKNWLPSMLNDKNSEFYYFLIPQNQFLCLDNTIMVDNILSFNNLQEDFNAISKYLNIDGSLEKLNFSIKLKKLEIYNIKNNKTYNDICNDFYFKDYYLLKNKLKKIN